MTTFTDVFNLWHYPSIYFSHFTKGQLEVGFQMNELLPVSRQKHVFKSTSTMVLATKSSELP